MEKLRHIELFTGGAFRSFELDICYPAAWGANGMEAALASLAAHAEDAIRQGYNILILSDRSVSRRHAADPGAARHRRRAPAPGAARACAPAPGLVVETGIGARSAPLRAARGLRRRGDPSVPRARNARRAARESCPEVDAEGIARSASSRRSARACYKVMSKMGISTYQSYCGAQIFEAVGLQQGVRRQVLHRHREQRRGHRPVRSRRGGAARCTSSRSATIRCSRDALDAGGEYEYRVRGEEHMWTPDSIAKLQHATRANSYVDVQGIRGADQRPGPAADDAARAVRVPDRRRHAGADRRSRAGGGDRQALRHRRDEPRLDLDRGAHDARGRDEPHRRQVEHRRRRRGSAALSRRDALGKSPAKDGDTLATIIGSDACRATSRCKAGDSLRSKIKQVASGALRRHRRVPGVAPTSCRSRWRRAPSPAKAASCPGHKVSEYIAQAALLGAGRRA